MRLKKIYIQNIFWTTNKVWSLRCDQ